MMTIRKNDPLRLDISYLINQAPGTHREFEISFPHLSFDPEFDLLDLDGKIIVSATEDGVLVEGRMTAFTQLECTRCLEPYRAPLEIDFAELYTQHPDENEEVVERKLPRDGQIELEPLIRQYGLLDIPIRHLCRENCQGLCIECGQNLNEEDCGHEQESLDPRMAKLKTLLDEEEIEEMQGE